MGRPRERSAREAVAVLVKEQAGQFGIKLPEEKRERLSSARSFPSSGPSTGTSNRVSCWVIEYRRDELVARTWVRVSDGKVLKQEAFHKGETVTIIRDE